MVQNSIIKEDLLLRSAENYHLALCLEWCILIVAVFEVTNL